MSKFGLIKSFDIDNGELNGLESHKCFVLGYELAQIDFMLKTGEPMHQPIHAENRCRIEKSCQDAGRHYRLNWMPGDVSESWLILDVAALPGHEQ